MPEFSHLNQSGEANMVDVSGKDITTRTARASGLITMSAATFDKVMAQDMAKGDVFAVSRIAGIQAAKKCADLIPLCHPLALSKVSIDFVPRPADNSIEIHSLCKLNGRTGVEMEALTAVSVAALTLFDMCKALGHDMVIGDIRVTAKTGGKSGDWQQS